MRFLQPYMMNKQGDKLGGQKWQTSIHANLGKYIGNEKCGGKWVRGAPSKRPLQLFHQLSILNICTYSRDASPVSQKRMRMSECFWSRKSIETRARNFHPLYHFFISMYEITTASVTISCWKLQSWKPHYYISRNIQTATRSVRNNPLVIIRNAPYLRYFLFRKFVPPKLQQHYWQCCTSLSMRYRF